MATLPLKASRKEQRSVVHFLWAKGLSSKLPMPFIQQCIQCMVTTVLLDQQYMFGVRSLLRVDSVFEKKQPGQRVVLTTDATIAAVDSFTLA